MPRASFCYEWTYTNPPSSPPPFPQLKGAIQRAGLAAKTLGFNEKSEFVNLLKAHREGNVFL